MVRVLTSQWEFTRLSSIKFSCSFVRDVVPTVMSRMKRGILEISKERKSIAEGVALAGFAKCRGGRA